MNSLPLIDISIIALYLLAMIGVGVYFSRKNTSTDQFTKASGHIPGWALGLSLYATFLSSNTFLGVPGKSFGSNWNSFVFSLSMPLAAWVAAKYFVPFYRMSGEVSAYTHLEHRFGPWARTYAMVCFVLTQLARMGSIFFGIALTLEALTGIDMRTIMVVSGICIIIYTMLGGMEAVIWTEVAQGVIKTIGALIVLGIVIVEMDNGFADILSIGNADQKFSLGSYSLTDFSTSTFWVVFLYGFFINLNNFGIDQNYVQRYHTAKNAKEASRSIWLCVYWYLPVSMLFFLIGTALYAYFQQHPELIESVKQQVALDKGVTVQALTAADYGDKVLPHFMVTKVPHGLLGLIIAAILSAAMSTISSGMNSSATVFLKDIYQRYIDKDISPKKGIAGTLLGDSYDGCVGNRHRHRDDRCKKYLGSLVATGGNFCRWYAGLVSAGNDRQKCRKCGRQTCHADWYPGDCMDDFLQSVARAVCWVAQSPSFEHGHRDWDTYDLPQRMC